MFTLNLSLPSHSFKSPCFSFPLLVKNTTTIFLFISLCGTSCKTIYGSRSHSDSNEALARQEKKKNLNKFPILFLHFRHPLRKNHENGLRDLSGVLIGSLSNNNEKQWSVCRKTVGVVVLEKKGAVFSRGACLNIWRVVPVVRVKLDISVIF